MNSFIKTSLRNVLLDPISGSRPKGGVNTEGDIISLGGENITMNGGIRFYPLKKITSDFFQSMSRGHLKDLDVLINKDGANTGKSAIYKKSPYLNAAVNEHLFILRGKEDELDQEYLHYLLQLSSVRAILDTKITGSAQPGLNSSFIDNFPVELPTLPEQKKIASILTSVDEVIENTQKQIDKLQDLKKATMNELLTKGIGHTEFKDSELGRIPKSWDVRKFKDLTSVITKGTTPTSLGFEFSESGVNFIKVEAIITDGNIDPLKFSFISEEVHKKLKRSQIIENDILITIAGATVGKLAVAERQFLPANTNQALAVVRTLGKKVLPSFAFYWLQSDWIKTFVANSQTIGAQPNISLSQIAGFPCPLPPIPDQSLIVKILKSVDSQIDNQKQKLAQTQFLKKSLMQDLLTGKVRV